MVKVTSWCFQTSFHSYPHDLRKTASNSIWARTKSSKCSTYYGDFTIIDVTVGVMLLDIEITMAPVLQILQLPRWPVSNVVDPMINLAPLGHWHVGMLSG